MERNHSDDNVYIPNPPAVVPSSSSSTPTSTSTTTASPTLAPLPANTSSSSTPTPISTSAPLPSPPFLRSSPPLDDPHAHATAPSPTPSDDMNEPIILTQQQWSTIETLQHEYNGMKEEMEMREREERRKEREWRQENKKQAQKMCDLDTQCCELRQQLTHVQQQLSSETAGHSQKRRECVQKIAEVAVLTKERDQLKLESQLLQKENTSNKELITSLEERVRVLQMELDDKIPAPIGSRRGTSETNEHLTTLTHTLQQRKLVRMEQELKQEKEQNQGLKISLEQQQAAITHLESLVRELQKIPSTSISMSSKDHPITSSSSLISSSEAAQLLLQNHNKDILIQHLQTQNKWFQRRFYLRAILVCTFMMTGMIIAMMVLV